MRRMQWSMAAMVAVLVALSGCVSLESTVQSRFAILSAEATTEDRLPAEPYDSAYDAIDVKSARYGGEAAGVRLWITVGAETGSVCMVVVPESPSLTLVGCGGDLMAGQGEEQLKVIPNTGPVVHLLVDGEPQIDTTAWEQVSENFWVE